MILREGRVFEKAGVNTSEVWGRISPELANRLPTPEGRFWAAGVSIVVHPRSPHVPAAHMNVRRIATQKHWFGGGADLTPTFPCKVDTQNFHQSLQEVCDDQAPGLYKKYKNTCDHYFALPHRGERRGVGGVFFDDLATDNWNADFIFVTKIAQAFSKTYANIVHRRMRQPWSADERLTQLRKRGRYVEFNLLYDRGTKFGLETGGDVEAIFMSLPPLVAW